MIKRGFAGISYGLIGYVLGLLTTFVLVVGRVQQLLGQTGVDSRSLAARASETPEVWQLIVWVFYSEHFMSIKVDSTSALGAAATRTLDQNAFSLYDFSFWNPALFLIPAVTILFVSFIFSYRTSDLNLKLVGVNGILITVGYALLGVVGALLSTYTTIGVRVHPDYAGLPILAVIALVVSLVGGGIAIPLSNSDSAN